MVNCHCRDCQRAGGAGHSPTIIVPASALRLTSGEPAYFSKPGDSGNIARRAFCPVCGTPLFASSSARPDMVGLRAASLDDASWFRPSADVWVGSAQPWDVMDPEVPKFVKNRVR